VRCECAPSAAAAAASCTPDGVGLQLPQYRVLTEAEPPPDTADRLGSLRGERLCSATRARCADAVGVELAEIVAHVHSQVSAGQPLPLLLLCACAAGASDSVGVGEAVGPPRQRAPVRRL
jgi:hypothetical protein